MVLDGSLHYLQCVTYAAILPIFVLFSMIWYCRIQSTAVSKERDVRWCCFRYSNPLSIDYVHIRVLIWISRLLHAHIAYEMDAAKIIAAFFRISYCLLDLIRLNSMVSHIQTARYTIMRISLVDSAINWLCLEFVYWYGYVDSFILILYM